MIDDDAELVRLEQCAEDAYSRMYDASNFTAATGHYSDVKGFLADAIGRAYRIGRADVAIRLELRLDHIRAVYRSQFS